MRSRLEDAKPFASAVFAEVRAENVTFMASSIAYQAFVSLIPLLALVFLVVAVVGDQSLANEITTATRSSLPPSAQELLEGYIQGEAANGTAGAGVVGIVTLLWGTLKIFRGLDTAFSEIYDSEAENSFLDQLVDGLVVLLTIAGAAVGAALATTAFATLGEIPFVGILSPLLLVGGLVAVFSPMYYLFPDVEGLSARQVLPGVLVAAVGWTVLQALFQVYIAYTGAGATSAQDVIGAILLLLTWLYLSGLVLLLGAVVNAVLAGRTGDARADATDAERSGGAAGAATDGAAERRRDERDPDAIRAERRALGRERERLDRVRAELAGERRELEAERSTDVGALRRENRELRRRLRWHGKPVWARALWRALGRRPG
jgi:membrane protein